MLEQSVRHVCGHTIPTMASAISGAGQNQDKPIGSFLVKPSVASFLPLRCVSHAPNCVSQISVIILTLILGPGRLSRIRKMWDLQQSWILIPVPRPWVVTQGISAEGKTVTCVGLLGRQAQEAGCGARATHYRPQVIYSEY